MEKKIKCIVCEKTKPRKSFKGKYKTVCNTCVNSFKKKEAPQEEKERNYISTIKREYSLTKEKYLEMFNSQEGCCKICKRHHSELNKRLVVDHNHVTGEVRALLCSSCNLALGLLREDELSILSMHHYVLKFNKNKDAL